MGSILSYEILRTGSHERHIGTCPEKSPVLSLINVSTDVQPGSAIKAAHAETTQRTPFRHEHVTTEYRALEEDEDSRSYRRVALWNEIASRPNSAEAQWPSGRSDAAFLPDSTRLRIGSKSIPVLFSNSETFVALLFVYDTF